MNFIEKILESFRQFMWYIRRMMNEFVDFLAKPFAFILSFFEGIFYFIGKFFQVAVEIIQLFVALFQYFFSHAMALMRTLGSFVGFAPQESYYLPSAARSGFDGAIEQLGLTGLLTTVPNVVIALIWLIFAVKMVALFGGKGEPKKS